MKDRMKVVSTKLPADKLDLLVAEAERSGRSVSDHLRVILAEHKELADLRADLEAMLDTVHVELSAALTERVVTELRQLKEGLKEEINAGREDQLKVIMARLDKQETTLDGVAKQLNLIATVLVNGGRKNG